MMSVDVRVYHVVFVDVVKYSERKSLIQFSVVTAGPGH